MAVSMVLCSSILAAGFVQGVTGFGAGIVFMSIAPYFMSVLGAAAVSNFVCLMLEVMMAIRYRRYIKKDIILGPALFFIAASTAGLSLAGRMDIQNMKKILGCFLVLLSVYMLLFQSRIKLKANLPAMLICGIISGLCDGMFSIGGPLMVLYFISVTGSRKEYLGTIQAFFMICAAYNLALRTYRGIFTAKLLGCALLGTAAIFIGFIFGGHVVDRINDLMMRKIVCVMIGISGAVTFGRQELTVWPTESRHQ